MASVSGWSDLPQELLRVIIAGLPFPADHARFRAVCRSWRSVPPPSNLPMVVLPRGYLLYPYLSGFHGTHPFSEHDRCIGSTDGWLAIDTTDARNNRRHTYALINPFSKTTVSLPELDAVIGNVSKSLEVHKVLLQSGLGGLIAIRTNNRNHPIILLKRGKDVWLPQPRSRPFTRIIDVAFLHDKLYGITRDEDLISFGVDFDTQGKPTVTSIKGVIKNQNDSNLKKDVLRKRTGDYIINDGMHFAQEDDDDDEKPGHHIVTIWYLVESCEELLMVRRQMHHHSCHHNSTRKVEVFKADVGARAWVPITDGLRGHALFVSTRFSKSVLARDEVEADAIYFIDTREVFNMRSNTTSPENLSVDFSASWLFHPGCL